MRDLIRGPNYSDDDSGQLKVKTTSICSDIIYAVTRGACKPAKNLALGLTVKSLTNSRQVITILNGHTIGYNLAEELETEMTHTSIQDNKVIPNCITAANGHSTRVAFDNFDRFVDTTSGKDTMHDTVGIIYQFSSDGADNFDDGVGTISSVSEANENENLEGPTRKRRRFNKIPRDIRPYYSNPKASMQL